LVALICTSFTYNDFLQPSRFEVRSALTGLADLDVQLNALPTGASRIEGCSPSNDLSTKDGKDELVQGRRSIIGTVRAFKRS
jgi:hypothetical protein